MPVPGNAPSSSGEPPRFAGDAFTGEFLTGEFFTGEFVSRTRDAQPRTEAHPATPRAAEADAARRPPRATPASRALLLFAFVDTAAIMVAALRMPRQATRIGVDHAEVALLVAAFALAQMSSAVAWGRLSDRTGRRVVLLMGLSLTLAAMALLPGATTFATLLWSRLLHGVGSATVGVAVAALMDRVVPSSRPRLLGLLGAATSAGAIAGPALVMLADAPALHAWPLLSAERGVIALALVALTAAWRGIPGAPATTPESLVAASATDDRVITDNGGTVRVRLIALYALLVATASGVPSLLPVLLSLDPQRAAPSPETSIMLLGALGVALRALIVDPLIGRYGLTRVLRTGMLAIAIALASLALRPSWATTVGALVLLATGTALTFPAIGALLVRATPASRRGSVLGWQQSVGGAARAAFPLGMALALAAGQVTFLLLLAASTVLGLAAWLHPARLSVTRSRVAGRSPADGDVPRLRRVPTPSRTPPPLDVHEGRPDARRWSGA